MTRPGGGTVTVTGASGFVGAHVVELLHERGLEVVGVVDQDDPAGEADDLVIADLAAGFPAEALSDVVIHLAGLTAVGPSFAEPQRYLESNSAMVTHLCETVLSSGRPVRTLVAGSAAVYGGASGDTPLDESAPLRPASPYAVSKVLVEYQVGYYRTRGLDAVVMRPFGSLGPGQGTGFLVPDLTAKVQALAPGEPLPTGPLDMERDYTDVRDVARAYVEVALAERPAHDVYNVASGRAVAVHDILALVCASLGRPVPALAIDPARARAADPSRVVGDASRLRREFGWTPRIPLATSITDYHEGLEQA
ncbi:NAD-dependent epimerase/dehydratase family protein [Propionicicella superfundia]|uniref:NAD-dependent epimerase/dehydratase family protein n=1 Tax=Propionicicella superfundia TaxID=348582 RepID=UPI00040F3AC2|nr:GDP-mannose 4,6-dehydratase [Propionicicella superfundia]